MTTPLNTDAADRPSTSSAGREATMVARVALAIEDAMASDANAPDDLARAAIETMRKPTDTMLDGKARDVLLDERLAVSGRKRPKAAVIADIWSAMIDDAMETKG